MKRILLSIFVCILTIQISCAQVASGTIVTGGFANFSNRIQNGSSSTTLAIQPQFGIALADEFVLGAFFNMNSIKDVSIWTISPFLRYYFNNFFTQFGYGYRYSSIYGATSSASIVDVQVGYAAFLNNYIALEPAIYYNGVFSNKSYSYSDIGFKIGFQIYFNR